MKGELSEVRRCRSNIPVPSWEFSCDLYDGVNDCFVYKDHNETIGHISWIYYKNDPNNIIELGADEGEIKYSLTLPQFRGRGIYVKALLGIQKYMKEAGCKRVFISVNENNISSIRGIEKAGFSLIAKVNLVKVAGMQINRRFVPPDGGK